MSRPIMNFEMFFPFKVGGEKKKDGRSAYKLTRCRGRDGQERFESLHEEELRRIKRGRR